jgi:hypothetical protein
MRGTLPAVVALFGLSTAAFAQQADDYALRFNGTTDFVAMPQTATAVNSFTIDLWVNPSAEHQVDDESLEGYAGIDGQRYAVYPSHGTHDWGRGHAGVGLSVGTNGVSVYEHAGDYIPAVLVHRQALSGWTRVTLVYRDRTPSLYIDGRLVRTGRQSPQPFVHPSTGDAHPGRMVSGIGGGPYGYYSGELDNVRIWSSALTDAEITSQQSAMTLPGLLLSLDMNQSGAGRGLIVANAAAIDRSALALTHGTERTPSFTLRPQRGETRIGAIEGPPPQISTPLEAATGRAYGRSSQSGPTIR